MSLARKIGCLSRWMDLPVDATKTPKEIDLNMEGQVGKGIYELEGDTLKIAHGEVGDARPKEFPKAGSGLTVLVLKRAKP